MLRLCKKSIVFLVSLGLVMFALSSCAQNAGKIDHKKALKPAMKKMRKDLVKQLQHEGMQVIKLGETFRIVIASDNLFNPNSANIRGKYKLALNTVAKLMRTYQTVNVKVAAYTDNNGDMQRQQALTTRQAQVVASYLWSKKIDARLEYAVGYNRKNPVGWNDTVKGRHFNRRVEISFRYYPRSNIVV